MSLSGEVVIIPSAFLSMQSSSCEAYMLTVPVPRFETAAKRPSMLTEVREGLAAAEFASL